MPLPRAIPVPLLSTLLLLSIPVVAQEAQPPLETQPAPATQAADEPRPAGDQPEYEGLTVTEHQAAGLSYRAITGTQPLKDDKGELRGQMFFTYYARLGGDGQPLHETQPRPVTYVFNGGPGAASIWLHLGTAGPFRVPLGDAGAPPAPPYTVQENESTWLDDTDLVFIDPIGTGFSRAAGEGTDEKMFYGVRQDVQWVAEFIRLHATRFEHWDDPKFLAGESYGTTRAAQLASYLHDRFGFDVNGVILISAVLDFATIRDAENNLLPYVLFLPSYTAAAHYHGKLPEDLQGDLAAARDAAEEFAFNRYLPALAKGGLLTEEERRRVAEEYARLTGLPVEYVLQSDLRVRPGRFMKALLNDQRQIVGRMDARLTAYDTDPINDVPNIDPSLSGYVGLYSGAFSDYVRSNLGYESDLPYEALSGRTRPWQASPEIEGSYSGGYLNVADDLREALVAVPSMQVLVASGYYDLATPYFAADYTIEQLQLPPELRDNVTQTYYGGGHMMYHVEEALEQLDEDVSAFIRSAAPTTQLTE